MTHILGTKEEKTFMLDARAWFRRRKTVIFGAVTVAIPFSGIFFLYLIMLPVITLPGAEASDFPPISGHCKPFMMPARLDGNAQEYRFAKMTARRSGSGMKCSSCALARTETPWLPSGSSNHHSERKENDYGNHEKMHAARRRRA